MPLRWKWRTHYCALLAALCAVAVEGCASWQGPRIDPSGQRIFIWPGETPAAVVPPPPAGPPPAFVAPGTSPSVAPPPVVTTPVPPPPLSVGLPTGNLQAPPVYPDAGLPTSPPPVITVPPTTPPPGAAPLSAPPVITTPSAAAPVAPPPTVDAQFAFPAPTIAQAGHPLVLTTIVTRRTDRAPLPGWLVRYEVARPAIGAGTAGIHQVEVPTDATGRSSIEISPTTTGSGEALVTVAVVAPPETSGPATAPTEIGRNTTRITWKPNVPGAPPWLPGPSAGALAMSTSPMVGPAMEAPSLTESSTPPPPTTSPPYGIDRQPNRFQPPPSLSDSTAPPKTYGPPPKQQPAAKPQLIVDVRRSGPEQVEVGGFARFDVTVTNRGDAEARQIKLLAKFDPGLSHVRAEANELAVKYEGMRNLMPGESATVPLTFGVRAAGRQCHYVTVTADDAAEATGTGCISAIEAKPNKQLALEVTKVAPTRHYVGEIAKFRTVIKNTGDAPVQNIVILDHYDDAIEPRRADSGREILDDGTLRWTIPLLGVGERRVFSVESACVSPAKSACSRVTVTADGDLNYAEEECVEIMLPLAPPPAVGGAQGTTPPPPLAAEGLQLSLRTSANPGRVGTPLSLYVFVENLGQQVQRGVSVRVQLPKGATADTNRIVPPGAFEMIGQMEVRFANIGDIGPGQRRDFEIPLVSNTPGVVTFTAQVTAAGMNQPIVKESDPIQIESAAQ